MDSTLFSEIADSMAMGLVVLNHDTEVVVWNDWIADASKIGRTVALGRPLAALFPELRNTRLLPAIDAALRDAASDHLGHVENPSLFPLSTIDGEPRAMKQKVVVTPFADGGGNRNCLIQIEDVTRDVERDRQLQEQTRQLQELGDAADEARRAKSEFLAAMRDEVRTPMNGVIGLINVLAESPLGGHEARLVEMIRGSADLLLTEIDNILVYLMLESGNVEVENRPMRLADEIERVSVAFDRQAREKQIELTLKIDPALPPVVVGDAHRLGQILTNLVTAGIKVAAGHDRAGKITVAAALLERREDRVWVRIDVAGTAVDLDPEDRSRPPEEPDPGARGNTLHFGGAGLGLAISRRLAQLMSGHLRVESGPRGRTVFSARLPFAVAATPPPRSRRLNARRAVARYAAPDRAAAIAQGRLILVVEDNDANREVIREQLQLLRYAADVAPNGVQALRMWRQQEYGAILTDIEMPEMDGYALVTAIRAYEASSMNGPGIPVIALTANAFNSDIDRCLASGMNAHLAKPVGLHLLWDTLEQWLPPVEGDGDAPAPPPEAPGADIDPSMLATIVGDNPELHRVLLAKFFESATATMQEIHGAYDSRAARELSELGHKLKSSARSVGAIGLANWCEDLEEAGRGDDWETIKHLHARADRLFEETRDRISRGVPERP